MLKEIYKCDGECGRDLDDAIAYAVYDVTSFEIMAFRWWKSFHHNNNQLSRDPERAKHYCLPCLRKRLDERLIEMITERH